MISLDLIGDALGVKFSPDPGERAVQFFEHLPAITGQRARDGLPIGSMPWQSDHLRKLYGTLDENGARQYDWSYLEIPRGNGKSTYGAGLILHGLFIDQEPAGELYSLGYTKEQARVVYDVVSAMIGRLPKELQAMVRVRDYYGIIEHRDSGATYKAVAAEKRGNYGKNPSLIVFDELHVQRSRELWDVMRTAMGKREQPILVAITTAGDSRETICYEIHEYAGRVLAGEIDDPTFLPIIFAADRDDDWRDPETWAKANPSLGTTVKLAFLEKECEYAQEVPAAQNSFQREYLNIWTQQTTRWLDPDVWFECTAKLSIEDYRGRECYAGLDLSSTTDLTALGLIFSNDLGGYDLITRFWLAEGRVRAREKREGIPFELWVKQGHLLTTPGDIIDYDFIRRDINALGDFIAFQEVAFDPWNATQISLQLNGDGFTMVPMRQGHQTMNEPSKYFEGLIVSRKLQHDGNPVMNWCISNVELDRNSTGAIRPVKPKDETRNVDGVHAAIMGLGRAMRHEEPVDLGELMVL